ncbi:hypothetical protein [Agromyces sp. NBRC 114283]|uniref:hypothetical protein n=1 Tax=Agromyces sp. NBRC 114283 TaxID=2994521 RepID=UPI0024A2D7DA|nr:hypothetical protein [Agromyces sp. NBRC 114283]GLU88962.1 hypothetical protein Agsp01_12170 [Agromyces sp. NBRC 114283]
MLRWFLADLRTGRQILDLQVMSGTWQRFLNAPEQIECTLNMRDPDTIALRPKVSAAVGRAVLAVANDDVVLAAGPIWVHDYDRSAGTLQLKAKGLWSYYDHRHILPVLAGTTPVTQFTIPDNTAAGKTKPNPAVGTYLNGLELGTIAKRLVQQAHAWTAGAVPVVFEADRPSASDEFHERNFEGAEFKNLGTVLKQLSEVEGGPDIRFMPRLTADRLGIEWVLQTGTEANPLLAGTAQHSWNVSVPDSPVSNFNITVDGSNLAGLAWANAGRSADEVVVARASDSWLVDRGWALFESLDSTHSSVSVQATLDAYAKENVAIGRGPVEEWSFTVEANTSPMLGEYWEGDWCVVELAPYDAEQDTGGDPYEFEGASTRRRITGISGDERGLTIDVTTAPEVS